MSVLFGEGAYHNGGRSSMLLAMIGRMFSIPIPGHSVNSHCVNI